MINHKVLILDANQRSALATTRSLGTIADTEVLCADFSTQSLAGSSRYCHAYYQCPNPKNEPQVFLGWLKDLITSKSITHLFPMTEITSQLLLLHREQFGNTILPFADIETVMALADKVELTILAQKLDIPYPDSRYFDKDASLPQVSIDTLPTVLKPALSHIWQDTHWLSTSVKIINSKTELGKALQLPEFEDHRFMQQEFIPGHGAGIFAIYNKGEALAFFAHERLREKPPRGGVSVLSRSVTPNPKLLAMSKQLLDAVNWHGVAMVEYRIGLDGTPYLMEVNTRFWGSLQLAIDSGVDFPKLLLNISNGDRVASITDYSLNQHLRWLLGDIDSLYLFIKDNRYTLSQKIKRMLSFFLPQANTKHEVNRLRDIKPAWFEFKEYLKAIIS